GREVAEGARQTSACGPAAAVGILEQAGEELLRVGRVDTVDKSSVLTIFLSAPAIAVVACAGGTRSSTPQTLPDNPERQHPCSWRRLFTQPARRQI
ncbi:hypothetical protein ACFUI0_14425, partial [Streptomyces sp. NPDC057199]